MNVSVLGCGRWGSFIAWYLDRQKLKVKVYGLESAATYKRLKETGTNGVVTFTPTMEMTSNLDEAVAHGEIIVISVGAQNLRSIMEEIKQFDLTGKTFVLCMKGIEDTTGKRLTQVMLEFIDPQRTELAVWVGPGHVQDFLSGVPNCMVIDSYQQETKERLVEIFSSDLIRFYYGNDVIGNELGAALKNVYGIAAGVLDGLNKTALKGALMSRGTKEVARLIGAEGGNPLAAYGLAHLGDYQATFFSPYSHNRMFGEKWVRGEKFESLAEGVQTTKAVKLLSEKYDVDMPICNSIYKMLFEEANADQVLSELFMRSIKHEF